MKEIVENSTYLNRFGKTRDEIKEKIIERKKRFNLITYKRLIDIEYKEKKEDMIRDIKEGEKDLLKRKNWYSPNWRKFSWKRKF